MPIRRTASKKDATHNAVKQAFKRAGWTVLDTYALGDDAPDMFVAKFKITIAVEVKTGKAKRREGQVAWADNWRGLYLWGSDPLRLLEEAEVMGELYG